MNEEEKIQRIFCPHCGSVVIMNKMNDQVGYKAIYQGSCVCGFLGVLAVKTMPAEPTFSLNFNMYQIAKHPPMVI